MWYKYMIVVGFRRPMCIDLVFCKEYANIIFCITFCQNNNVTQRVNQVICVPSSRREWSEVRWDLFTNPLLVIILILTTALRTPSTSASEPGTTHIAYNATHSYHTVRRQLWSLTIKAQTARARLSAFLFLALKGIWVYRNINATDKQIDPTNDVWYSTPSTAPNDKRMR